MLRYGTISRLATMLVVAGTLGLAGCETSPTASVATSNATNAPVGAGVNVTPGSKEDFIVHVGRRIFFNEGSAAIDGTDKESMELQSRWLLQYPTYKVRIQGHADDSGGADINRRLSQERAEAVKAYLVAKGVDAGRLTTQAVGNTRPQLRCADISCKAPNRRVVVQLL